MAVVPDELGPGALAFLAERHLATLTTLRPDGRPHVVPVGFTYASGLARVITSRTSVKAGHARGGGPAVLCQVDGARWLSLIGRASLAADPGVVADAEARYAVRYRPPRDNPLRVVILIVVDQVLGSASLLS